MQCDNSRSSPEFFSNWHQCQNCDFGKHTLIVQGAKNPQKHEHVHSCDAKISICLDKGEFIGSNFVKSLTLLAWQLLGFIDHNLIFTIIIMMTSSFLQEDLYKFCHWPLRLLLWND